MGRAAILLWCAGCSARALYAGDETGGGTTETSATDDAPPVATTSPATSSTTSGSSTSSTTSSTSIGDSSSSSDGGFISRPDGGGAPGWECDPWLQNCEPGFKCVPYSGDGGSWWTTMGCFPIVDDPQGLYEPCTYQDHPWSGYDDCGWAAVCWQWSLDEPGICKGLCLDPDPDNGLDRYVCEDPEAVPTVGCQSCFCSCERACDPLLQDCMPGEACYPLGEDFLCATDASGDVGAYGDPCEYINSCDPGLFCSIPDAVPGCMGALGCCSEFCDLSAPNDCSGAAQGQECTPWYVEGQAPPGLELVGACAIPQ